MGIWFGWVGGWDWCGLGLGFWFGLFLLNLVVCFLLLVWFLFGGFGGLRVCDVSGFVLLGLVWFCVWVWV